SSWARSAGAISSPAKPLGLEVPMGRQDGRSESNVVWRDGNAPDPCAVPSTQRRRTLLFTSFSSSLPHCGGSMKIKAPFLTPVTINILSIAIVACAIFVVDTQVHVDIDVPVLYVAVVLMSTRLFDGRGILIVSLGCAVLTVAGYLLSPGNL